MVIYGLGGMGKTQLAASYVQHHQAKWPDGIFWLRGDRASTLTSDLASLAWHVNLPEREHPEQERQVAAVLRWLREHVRWLLVIDALEEEGEQALQQWLPYGLAGAVLVTSRTPRWAVRLGLEPLPVEIAVSFLLHRTRQIDNEAATRVANTLGCLPLALEQAAAEAEHPPAGAGLARGLAGVVLDTTAISHIDADGGRLSYRGHDVDGLAASASFEEVTHLLLRGSLPGPAERDAFDRQLRGLRDLSGPAVALLEMLRDASPGAALRTCISALPALEPERFADADLAEVRLVAVAPTIVATHHALSTGRPAPCPDAGLGHAANLLSMIGLPVTEREVGALELALVLQAEHGSNASSFAARVVSSTGADLVASVVAAIAAFEGRRHGGATADVVAMVDAVGSPDEAAAYVRDRRRRRLPVSGFGHRVYRTADPRSRHLRAAVAELAAVRSSRELDVLEAIRGAMGDLAQHGLDVNVDFYLGALYRLIGIPDELFVPVFVIARMPGWLAHAREQAETGVLIRPLLRYRGPIHGAPS